MVAIPFGFLQCVVNFTAAYRTDPLVTVFGLSYDTGASPLGAANAVHAAFAENLENRLNFNYTMTHVEVMDESFRLSSTLPPVPGGSAESASPPNTCILWKKDSSLRGREHQGRNYWPGYTHDGVVGDGGEIDSGWLASLQGDFDAFRTDMFDESLELYILHNDGATAPSAVATTVVQGKVATQRRRLR